MTLIRRLLRILPWLVGLLAASLVALFLAGRLNLAVEAPGEIVIEEIEVLRAELAGRLVEVLVAPGDRVAAGALVARLEDRELRQQVAEGRERLEALRRRGAAAADHRRELAEHLHPLELGQERSELERLERGVELEKARREERQIELELARQRQERLERLAAAGLVSEQTLKEAQLESRREEWRLRQGEIEEDRGQGALGQRRLSFELLRRQQGWSLEEKDQELRRLTLESAELAARVADLERRLAACQVVARREGWVVGAPAAELIGRWVEPGTELLRVVSSGGVVFEALVAEEERVKIAPDQQVLLELRGLPKKRYREFRGRVRSVSALPKVTDLVATTVYPVTIEIEEPWVEIEGRHFFPQGGMSGIARITVEPDATLADALYEFLR